MAFDYTNLYPDTSGNGGYTKSWNYTTVTDSIATCSASGYFNKVASRLGIGDNIVIARVDAFESRTRTTLIEYAELFVTGISNGVVTTINYSSIANAYTDAAVALKANIASPTFTGTPAAPTATPGTNTTQLATTAYADAIAALKANLASPTFTGTPAAPTAAAGTNTTQLATTAGIVAERSATKTLTNTTFDTAGTGNSLQVGSVAVSRGQFPGTNTNDSATAGNLGEYGENTLVVASAVSLTNNTAADIITVSLTAGDYDVWGVVVFSFGGTTVITQESAYISTTTNTYPGNDSGAVGAIGFGAGKTGGPADFVTTPVVRMSLSATTTVRLGARALFTTSTASASGTIKWRRRR